MAKKSLVPLVIDALIFLSMVAAVGVVGLLVTNIAQIAPSVSIGEMSVRSLFPALQVEMPLTISNPGSFEVSNVSLKLSVEAEDHVQLLSGTMGPMNLPAGAKNVKATAVITVNTSKIPPATLQRLISNSENLTVKAEFYTDVPPFVKVSGSALGLFPWGPPVHNLKLSEPRITSSNATGMEIDIDVSFDNLSELLPISGTGSITVFDSDDNRVGSGFLAVDASPKSSFNKTLSMLVGIPVEKLSALIFNDTLLSYRAVAEFKSFDVTVFTREQTFSFDWGAPLKNFIVGKLSISDFSESAIHAGIPVSFENHASWIDITAPLTLKIYNASSNALMGTNVFQITAPALHTFIQTFPVNLEIPTGALDSLMFYDSVQDFKVEFSGSFSGFTFNTIKTYSYDWGAPIKHAQLGSPTIQSYNLTHAKVLVPINFTNNSDFFAISGTLSSTVLDVNNNVVGAGESVTLSVAHNAFFSSHLITYVDANYVNSAGDSLLEDLKLNLTFNTSYGTVQRRLIINA